MRITVFNVLSHKPTNLFRIFTMSQTPRDLFDELADNYETMRDELDWSPFEHVYTAFENEDLSGKEILDVGCGTGEIARLLQKQGEV